MAGEEELTGDYLQLRKDLMKVPKQFYLNKDPLSAEEQSNKVGDYFKYMSGDDEKKPDKKKDKPASPLRAPATTEGGHPLVPRLNLPQPD